MTTDVDARLSTQPPHSWWSLRDNHSCVTHTVVATTSQLQPHGFPHVDTPLDTGIARLQSPASPGSQPDSSHRCDIVVPASTVASPPASTRLSQQRHSHASTAAGSHRDSRSTALSPACPHPLMASSRQGRARTDRLSRRRHSSVSALTPYRDGPCSAALGPGFREQPPPTSRQDRPCTRSAHGTLFLQRSPSRLIASPTLNPSVASGHTQRHSVHPVRLPRRKRQSHASKTLRPSEGDRRHHDSCLIHSTDLPLVAPFVSVDTHLMLFLSSCHPTDTTTVVHTPTTVRSPRSPRYPRHTEARQTTHATAYPPQTTGQDHCPPVQTWKLYFQRHQ